MMQLTNVYRFVILIPLNVCFDSCFFLVEQETLAFIDSMSDSLEGKEKTIVTCFARGKALNVKQTYSEESFEQLSRAVKLSPNLTEAWIELGNSYWKKGDVDSALNCFETAKKLDGKNKECLRSLSILMRSLKAPDEKTRMERLDKSLSLAKEAVEVDMTDGSSWTILGNTYLILYCCSARQDSSLLRQCKVSYTRAKTDPIEASQPDFLYNYANLLQLEEEYQEAIDVLSKVMLMDPEWKEPSDRRSSILSTLRDMASMVNKKASLKNKRLENYVAQLKLAHDVTSTSDEMTKKTLKQLEEGRNLKSFIHLKIIGSVQHNNTVCLTVCCIDSDSSCVSVNIYNLGREPKIGDTITIVNPDFKRISVHTHDGQGSSGDAVKSETISFPAIKVENPLMLFLNGRRLALDSLVKPRVENILMLHNLYCFRTLFMQLLHF